MIFISATGRTLHDYLKESADQNIHEAKIVLLTQNVKYKKKNDLGLIMWYKYQDVLMGFSLIIRL